MISKKINNTDESTETSDKIDLKNEETSQPSYQNDYIYYIKNPNILADKIVEIYNANPNASIVYPRNKQNNVKIHELVKKISNDQKLENNIKNL